MTHAVTFRSQAEVWEEATVTFVPRRGPLHFQFADCLPDLFLPAESHVYSQTRGGFPRALVLADLVSVLFCRSVSHLGGVAADVAIKLYKTARAANTVRSWR